MKLIDYRKFFPKMDSHQTFIEKHIQKFVINMFNQRPPIATVPKKELTDYFTLFRLLSDIVQIRLIKTMINAWNFINQESFSRIVIT